MPFKEYLVQKNPIVDVIWAGWRSNTLSLQQAGWQLAIEEDVSRRQLRIAIHHPVLSLYGVMDRAIEYIAYIPDCRIRHFPEFQIKHMATQVNFTQIINLFDDYGKFKPFDATPQIYTQKESEIKSIADLRIFRPIENLKEIVVEPRNVDELLSRILELQSPKQAEIREKARKEMERQERDNVIDFEKFREVYNPQTDIIAQIISVR